MQITWQDIIPDRIPGLDWLSDSVRIASRLLSNKLTDRPFYVGIEVTRDCNLNCGFCGYGKNNKETERMEPAASYLKVLHELNPVFVTFTGGEPLLRDDLETLVGEAKHMAQVPIVAVTTNGLLLNQMRYKRLSKAGADIINISLDYMGVDHDSLRGQTGLHLKIIDLLRTLKGGAKIGLNVIVMYDNLGHLSSIIKEAKYYGATVSLQPLSPNGKYGIPKDIEERRYMADTIKRLKQDYPNVITYPLAAQLKGMERFFEGTYNVRCEAGKSFMWVLPDARIAGCIEHPNSFGTLEDARKFYVKNNCTKCLRACRMFSEDVSTLDYKTLRSRPFAVARWVGEAVGKI